MPRPDSIPTRPRDGPSLFLAGGITARPDWQSDARALLADAPIVVNPSHSGSISRTVSETIDLARLPPDAPPLALTSPSAQSCYPVGGGKNLSGPGPPRPDSLGN